MCSSDDDSHRWGPVGRPDCRRILAGVTTRKPPPKLVLRWEALSPGVQVAIAGPVMLALLWAAHVFLMNQPIWRGLGYAVFWGVFATGAVVAASRNERARREREAAEGERPEAPGPPLH